MSAASDEVEGDRQRLPALREERWSSVLKIAYGVILALVIGSAALAFGLVGSKERGATIRTLPADLPAPSTPLSSEQAGAASAAEVELRLPVATKLEESVAPSPSTIGSLKLPPRPEIGDPSRPIPAPAGFATLGKPLIRSLPDPAPKERLAVSEWKPLAAHGQPEPRPVKPLASASLRALPSIDSTEMIEVTADGLRLPRISAVGWMPWIAYARRYAPDGPPARAGVMMINLGANEAMMKRAIEELPGEVSLAFLAATPDLDRWLRYARDFGHEVYLMLPVEDPGGRAERAIRPIETSVDAGENLRRLRTVMAKGEGYVGFVVPFPGPVSQSETTFRPIMKEISDRGLAIVEINAAPVAPAVYRLTVEMAVGYARNSIVLDYQTTRQHIADNLERMVKWISDAARDKPQNLRHAFGVVQPSAAGIDAIVEWSQKLANQPGVALLPVIAHFECREACMMRVRRLQAQPRQ